MRLGGQLPKPIRDVCGQMRRGEGPVALWLRGLPTPRALPPTPLDCEDPPQREEANAEFWLALVSSRWGSCLPMPRSAMGSCFTTSLRSLVKNLRQAGNLQKRCCRCTPMARVIRCLPTSLYSGATEATLGLARTSPRPPMRSRSCPQASEHCYDGPRSPTNSTTSSTVAGWTRTRPSPPRVGQSRRTAHCARHGFCSTG